MSRKPLADPLVEEAIQWMVRLQSGETTEQERRALEHWLSTSPRHEAAFQKISQGLSPLRESPWRSRSGDQLLSAMRAPSGRRQFLRASLALAGLAPPQARFYVWNAQGWRCPAISTPAPASGAPGTWRTAAASI